jgi:electron transfer flavoprotein alpha subunit
MSKILVFVEHTNGKLKRSASELLTAAKKSGGPVIALAVGAKSADLSAELGKYGTDEVLAVSSTDFENYNPELFAGAVTEAIQKSQATIVLASASSLGRDLFPRVAARLNTGIISDATEIQITGEDVVVKKPVYSGKAFAKMGFENAPIKIVLMRANQLPISESTGPAKVTAFLPAKVDIGTLVKEVVKGTSEKLDLTEANIIVSGGRGLKEASNFKMLNDLAEVLGATVGASRAVVDAGWVSHGMQVGQTGKTVAPSLYIAVGISGAIQHLAGMSGSKVIVAINNDPNAPIFQKATYGIVGDAFEVVPKLIEEFKKALQ